MRSCCSHTVSFFLVVFIHDFFFVMFLRFIHVTYQNIISFRDCIVFRGMALTRLLTRASTDGRLGCFQGGPTKAPVGGWGSHDGRGPRARLGRELSGWAMQTAQEDALRGGENEVQPSGHRGSQRWPQRVCLRSGLSSQV